jgi:hypothetical protein
MKELPENLKSAPWVFLGESLSQMGDAQVKDNALVMALQSMAASMALANGGTPLPQVQQWEGVLFEVEAWHHDGKVKTAEIVPVEQLVEMHPWMAWLLEKAEGSIGISVNLGNNGRIDIHSVQP